RRRGAAKGAGIGVSRSKRWPVLHLDVIGGRGVETAPDVDRRGGAKHYAAGIDLVEAGPGGSGCNLPLDVGLSAAGHSSDHVLGRCGTAEGGGLADRRVRKIELAKAVEQIAADLLAEIGGDCVVGPDQGLRR